MSTMTCPLVEAAVKGALAHCCFHTHNHTYCLRTKVTAAKLAWTVPYRGEAPAVLRAVVRKSNSGGNPVTKQIHLIQSSGMGKSRCVDELAKSVFTIPFNLREATDEKGYHRMFFAYSSHAQDPYLYRLSFRRPTCARLHAAAYFLSRVNR
jgi:hypothetical protein